ncbi:MAG TPA: hypothetical protein VEQ18_00265, partial [Candidatus Nitrosocosmicus sp.]|nr:hypothetical protein [Candidatus Nitrosocosmicus sp.]
LEAFSKNVGGEIHSVAMRLGQLENPIQKSADFIQATSTGFETRTEKFLDGIKREFQNQNQQKETENSNLANLNDGVRTLVNEINQLTGKIEKLNQKDFGQPNLQGRKKENDIPQILNPKSKLHPEPEEGFFKKLINKFRRGKK